MKLTKQRQKEIANDAWNLLSSILTKKKETFIKCIVNELEKNEHYQVLEENAEGNMIVPRYIAQAIINNEVNDTMFINFSDTKKHKKNVTSIQSELYYAMKNAKFNE